MLIADKFATNKVHIFHPCEQSSETVWDVLRCHELSSMYQNTMQF